MPDREYGGGSYNSGYGGAANVGSNPRAGDTPGFDSGGGGGQTGGFDDRRGGGTADWQSQGRGSNVTSAQPMSPAEVAGGLGPGASSFFNNATIIPGGQGSQMYFPGGQQPTINIPQGGSPFFSLFSGSTILPTTVGTPSILLTQQGSPALPLPPGPQQGQRDQGQSLFNYGVTPVEFPQTSYPSFQTSPYGLQNVSPTSYQQDALRELSLINAEKARRVAGQQRAEAEELDNFIAKTAGVESNFGKVLDTLTSTAKGIFQFTEDTWMRSIKALRPDIYDQFEGDTPEGKKAILDLRKKDPALQTEVMRGFTKQNADLLSAYGEPVTQRNLYITHFLGAPNGLKLLKADDDAPAASVVGPGPVNANPTIFKEGTTVRDIKEWAGKKMSSVNTDRAREYLSSISGDRVASIDIPASRTYTYDTMPKGPVLAGGGDQATAEAAARAAAEGGQQTAAQAASSSPQTFGSWLNGLFDTGGRISELEAKGRTALFPDQYSKEQLVDEENNPISPKEWYRQDMERQLGRPVNESEIKSRIVDYGQGQQVDYYMKDLMSAITGGQKDNTAFPQRDTASQVTNQTAGQAASSNPDSFYNWLASQFNQPERRDFGPYGNLTIEEYRRLYGR